MAEYIWDKKPSFLCSHKLAKFGGKCRHRVGQCCLESWNGEKWVRRFAGIRESIYSA